MPLIQLASFLESVGEESMGSPTPTEEALLLGEDPEPQGAQASALCIPIWPEEALKSEVTAGVASLLNIQ